MNGLWAAYREGTCSPAMSLLFGVAAAVVVRVAALLLLRPLIQAFSNKDNIKIYQSRERRTGFAMSMASLALGVYIASHAYWPPDVRSKKIVFDVAELLLFVFSGYVFLEILLCFFGDWLPRVRSQSAMAPIIKDLVRALALVGVFMLGVKVAFPDIDIGAIMTTSAILSVVVGLALQESLSNVFAGIMLTIDRPYKAGDWVEVDGKEGKVLDSNWRSTRVLTRDDDIIYVPNSTMAKGNIINLTDPTPEHLCKKRIGVEYGAPPNKVRNVLVDLMAHVDGVLATPAPDVFLVEFGDSAILYELRYWIVEYDRRVKIEAEIMRGVWYRLKREGISIPYPIRDVFLHRAKPEERPDEILALLKKVDILEPLKEGEQTMLAEDLSHHLFGRGEVICRQGDPGSTFYIIKSGVIGVKVKGADGVEVEVARLQPGSYFGEMSLLTGDARTSTCTALEDSELLCLDRDTFGVLLSENPPIAQTMSDILAARSQATQKRLSQERETLVRRSSETDSGSHRILEKIWTIFRPKK
ncbi:MAG TPA: mechanosensitive ion channel family protein [Planctomycetota bacterium]|nr:mechanosensitive ion channel family protein [Planctomycetota bacterium]